MKATDRQRILDKSKLKWSHKKIMSEYLKFKHVIQAPIIPTSKQTRFNTDLGS